jgi:chromosome segregation ATPase
MGKENIPLEETPILGGKEISYDSALDFFTVRKNEIEAEEDKIDRTYGKLVHAYGDLSFKKSELLKELEGLDKKEHSLEIGAIHMQIEELEREMAEVSEEQNQNKAQKLLIEKRLESLRAGTIPDPRTIENN